jgi:hypothetical protein
VYVVEQLADVAVGCAGGSVHGFATKLEGEINVVPTIAENATVPVGDGGRGGRVAVTVAVQTVGLFTVKEGGLQLTRVVVAPKRKKPKVKLLGRCVGSPV